MIQKVMDDLESSVELKKQTEYMTEIMLIMLSKIFQVKEKIELEKIG